MTSLSDAYRRIREMAGEIHRLRQRALEADNRLEEQYLKDRATHLYHDARALELKALPSLHRDSGWIIDAELADLETGERAA